MRSKYINYETIYMIYIIYVWHQSGSTNVLTNHNSSSRKFVNQWQYGLPRRVESLTQLLLLQFDVRLFVVRHILGLAYLSWTYLR